MKRHKIEFTENELKKLNLAIGYYNHVAQDMDSFSMLVHKELLDKIRKMIFRRLYDFQFTPKTSTKMTLTQIEIDLLWKCLGEMEDLREVLIKIGSKTHSYAA